MINTRVFTNLLLWSNSFHKVGFKEIKIKLLIALKDRIVEYECIDNLYKLEENYHSATKAI